MDIATVEGALVMKDLASAVIRRVDEAMERLEGRAGATAKAVDKAGAQFDRISDRLKSVGGALTSVGTKLSFSVTAPIVTAAAASLKFSADFESAMTKVVTLSGNSAEEMAEMRKQVLALAPAVGKGPQELADALLVITSTGLKGAKAMEVLEASARAGAVGLGETKDVARAITSAVTAYGDSNLSAARAAEVLFKAVKDGGAEANEFAGTLGRVVGIAAQTGVSFQELTGFVATFTRLGVDAAEATTALRAVMTTFLQPTREAEQALAGVGLTIQDVRDRIKKDGLADALLDLNEAFKGNDQAMAAVFGNVRGLAGVLGVTGAQANNLREIIAHLNQETNELGEGFVRTSKTTAFTFNQITAQARTLSIQFGDRLAPAFKAALEAAKPLLTFAGRLADAFSALPRPAQTAAVALLAIAAAAGPILYLVGVIAKLTAGVFGLAAAATRANVMTNLNNVIFTLGNTVPVLTARIWALNIAQEAAAIRAGLWGKAQVFLGASLFALGNSLPVLTARVWLLDTAQKASAATAAITARAQVALSGAINLVSGSALVMGARMAVASAATRVMGVASTIAASGVTVLNTALAGLVAIVPILALLTTLAVALKETAEGVRNLSRAASEGGWQGFWKAITAKDDNTFLRRWLGLSKGIKDTAGAMDEAALAAERLKQAKDELSGRRVAREMELLAQAFGELTKEGKVTPDVIKRIASAAEILQKEGAKLPPVLQAVIDRAKQLNNTPTISRSNLDRLKDAETALRGLTAEQRRNIEAGLKLGDTHEAIVGSLVAVQGGAKVTVEVVRLYEERMKAAGEATKKATEDLRKLRDEFSGAADLKDFANHLKVVAEVAGGAFNKLTTKELKDLDEQFKRIVDRAKRFGIEIDASVLKAGAQIRSSLTDPMRHYGDALAHALGLQRQLAAQRVQNVGSLLGTDKITEAARAVQDLGIAFNKAGGDIKKLDAEKLRESFGKLTGGIAAMMKAGEPIPQAWNEWVTAILVELSRLDGPLVNKLADLPKKLIPTKAPTLDTKGFVGKLVDDIGKAFGGVKEFGQGLAGTIMSALTGGGDVGKSVGGFLGGKIGTGLIESLSRTLGGGAISKAIGGVLGSVLPGLGTILGSIGGGLVSKLFGGLFGGDARKTKKLRAEFLDAAGGIDQVRKMAEYAGVSVDRLLNTRKSKEFTREVERLEAAFKAAQERVATLKTDIDAVMSRGDIIPPDLWRRIINDKDKEEIRGALKQIFEASVDRAAEGFNKIAQNFLALASGFKTGSKDMQQLIKGIDEALADRSKRGKFADEFLASVKEKLAQLRPIAEAAFGALIAKGHSFAEALQILEPGLARIQQVLTATGQKAGGFLGELLKFRRVIDNNKELFESLSGVNDMLVGLQNSGFLTQDAFAGLSGIVADAFETLRKNGASASVALQAMQPQLQKLWELSTDFGFSVDKATQKLIDQAVASGKVGDKFRPAADRMAEGIDKLLLKFDEFLDMLDGGTRVAAHNAALSAQKMGIEVGEAIDGIPKDIIFNVQQNRAQDAADFRGSVMDQIRKIPKDINIRVDWIIERPELPSISGGSYSYKPPQLGIGGIVTRPTLAEIGEKGPEAVVPLDRLEQWIGESRSGREGVVYNFEEGSIVLTPPPGSNPEDYARRLWRELFREMRRGGDLKDEARSVFGE